MIYHWGGSLSKQGWFNVCHGTQTMDNSRIFVTVCCSMSMVSKTSCSRFSGQQSQYGYTHAWTNFIMKSWAESQALMSVIMHGSYLKRTQLRHTGVFWWYCLWAACPCLSWSAPTMCALTWVVFAPGFFMPTGCALASFSMCANSKCTYPFIQFKFW